MATPQKEPLEIFTIRGAEDKKGKIPLAVYIMEAGRRFRLLGKTTACAASLDQSACTVVAAVCYGGRVSSFDLWAARRVRIAHIPLPQ